MLGASTTSLRRRRWQGRRRILRFAGGEIERGGSRKKARNGLVLGSGVGCHADGDRDRAADSGEFSIYDYKMILEKEKKKCDLVCWEVNCAWKAGIRILLQEFRVYK